MSDHAADTDLPCPTCLLVREEPDEPIQAGDYYTVNPASPSRCPSCGLIPGRDSEGARRVVAARMTPAPFIAEGTYVDRRVGVEFIVLSPAERDERHGRLPEVFIPRERPDLWTCELGGACATTDDLRAYAEAILAALDRVAPAEGSNP